MSVVLPAYNAERTLARMVDSLLAQTLADFELLIVDDGSTDGTAALCDAYAARDSRVRVFHQPNGGVSAARQLGVDQARGEYSIHADADDWVEPTMLEEMYAKAKETDADVVIADFYSEDGEKTRYVKQQPTSLEASQVLRDLFQQLHGSCWNKLVRRVCYNNYHVRFPVGIDFAEDSLTWIELYTHPITTAYLPKAFYHYIYNDNSISHHFTREKYETRCRTLAVIDRLLPEEIKKPILEGVELGIMMEGYQYGVLSGSECREKYGKIIRKQIVKTKSVRWKIGFLCLWIGIDVIAKRLLKMN